MVLHVVTHVEGQSVERPVVRIGFLTTQEHVVLADEMASQWMKTHRQERTGNEINQRLDAEKVEDGSVEGNLERIRKMHGEGGRE